jgi:hypothetical protein
MYPEEREQNEGKTEMRHRQAEGGEEQNRHAEGDDSLDQRLRKSLSFSYFHMLLSRNI